MFKKALAVLALAATATVLAPQAGFATEPRTKEPAPAPVESEPDASTQEALSSIERRLAADVSLARQVVKAAEAGDSEATARLLSSDGTEVVGVGSSTSSSESDPELNAVRITIKVTVCVRIWGTIYCGTITVTVDL